MVFSCLKCNARYRIDEKRLEGKVLRFTCRKCNQSHLLRDPAKGGETVTAVAPTGSQPAIPGTPRRITTAQQAARDLAKPTRSMPTVGQRTPATRRPTTQTGALPVIPAEQSAAKAKAIKRKDIWFAIKKGRRIGPLLESKIGQILRDGKLHDRSFVWRPTMPAWVRMNQVPELSGVVAEFIEWKTRQYEQTVVRPPPDAGTPTPFGDAAGDSPPPLPADSSNSGGSASFADAPDPASDKEMVDSLYSTISKPAIDIRKANEVQPEEPEIPDADQPPPLPPAAPAAPTPKPEAPPEDEDLFPSEGSDTESGQFFVDKAVVLPAKQWPAPPEGGGDQSTQSAASAQAITFGEAAATHASVPPTAGAATDTRLEDFSVMVRLSRKGRQHKVVVLSALGFFLAGGIGLVLYLALTADPVSLGVDRSHGETPVFKQKLYAIMKPPPEQELEPAVVPINNKGRKAYSGKPRKPAGIAVEQPSVLDAPPPEPTLAKLGELDPNTKAEFDRYAEILTNGSDKRGEAAVDVKPRTMTEMPKHSFDKTGMDAFLATKMRKFSDCKRRMTQPTDMPVKVGLAFSIGMNGRVGNILVNQSGGTRDLGLDTCIRRVVGGWAFPPPEETTTYKTTLLL